MAEILILIKASEVGQRLNAWLHEIHHGAEEARDLIDLRAELPTILVTDAYDVFAALQCSKPYSSGANEALASHMEVLR